MPLQVTELQHSLVQHHLSSLRATNTPASAFRHHVTALSTLLLAEATRELNLAPREVETPLETMTGHILADRIAVVPILRAGVGMVNAATDLIPEAEVWHLGLYRNEETAQPVRYYDKLPRSNPPGVALVLDPMLATGGSASAAIDTLKEWSVPHIQMLALIAAPEGIERLNTDHPDVQVLTCVVDRELNDLKYICPGLGDAGDRIFNT